MATHCPIHGSTTKYYDTKELFWGPRWLIEELAFTAVPGIANKIQDPRSWVTPQMWCPIPTIYNPDGDPAQFHNESSFRMLSTTSHGDNSHTKASKTARLGK